MASFLSDADPVAACGGRPVGLAWFSPDQETRDLASDVVSWAAKVRPRMIVLENVEGVEDLGALYRDLARLGYQAEWRLLFRRLILIARCDGVAITWPKGGR